MSKDIQIREATDTDLEQVLSVERAAFDQDDEAMLVRALLEDDSAKPVVSLLAFDGDRPIAHILFTKASLLEDASLALSILAPLAVIPEYQKQGVGGKLIKEGLQILTKLNFDFVFVLGYPDYYSRHGFRPAGKLGFNAPYPILEKNADAWMVKALRPDVIESCNGTVMCADILNKPEYWQE